jgi:hypothetical protein
MMNIPTATYRLQFIPQSRFAIDDYQLGLPLKTASYVMQVPLPSIEAAILQAAWGDGFSPCKQIRSSIDFHRA